MSDRNGVQIHDLSYQSPLGGSVPAYMVVPHGTGPFAVVLYGHWMMHGSPLMNRKEFLDEAILLARSGALCLLIDAPFVRAGFVEEKDLLRNAIQAAEASRQQVIDFYAAGHALNAVATTDRVMYLQERLRLNRIDPTESKNIPEIK